MRNHALIFWLVTAVFEGAAAGLVAGHVLLLVHTELQVLLSAQPEPLLAQGAVLGICTQIGVLTSIVVSTACDHV